MKQALIPDSAFGYVDSHEAAYLERLIRLIKQPSVSPTGEGVRDCAALLAKLYDEIGCETTEIVETEGNPAVSGEIPGEGPKTLLVYLMYDTQPYTDAPCWPYPPLGGKIDTLDLRAGGWRSLF